MKNKMWGNSLKKEHLGSKKALRDGVKDKGSVGSTPTTLKTERNRYFNNLDEPQQEITIEWLRMIFVQYPETRKLLRDLVRGGGWGGTMYTSTILFALSSIAKDNYELQSVLSQLFPKTWEFEWFCIDIYGGKTEAKEQKERDMKDGRRVPGHPGEYEYYSPPIDYELITEDNLKKIALCKHKWDEGKNTIFCKKCNYLYFKEDE